MAECANITSSAPTKLDKRKAGWQIVLKKDTGDRQKHEIPIFRGGWETDIIGRAARFGYGAAHFIYLFTNFFPARAEQIKNGRQYDK